MKRFLALLLVLAIIGAVGYGVYHFFIKEDCEHSYDNNCDATCNLCGEARDQQAHQWKDATCTTLKTCTVCGTTEGEMLPHNWEAATCIATKTCKTCGTTEGAPLGHTPAEDDGDCTTEVKCTACGKTTTEASAEHISHGDDGDCTTPIKCVFCEQIILEAKAHNFTDEWKHSETQHWHECLNEGCDITDGKTDHNPNIESATDTVSKKCIDCEYIIEHLHHTCSYTMPGRNDTHHYIMCYCGQYDESSAEAHSAISDNDCTTADNCSCGYIVTAAKEHTPAEDDGDCTTEVECTECEAIAIEAREHTPGEEDYDCTTALKCAYCEYIFTEAMDHSFSDELGCNETYHYYYCLNDTCLAETNEEEHYGVDDGDCTTWILCECGWLIKEANESHTPNADDGNCLTAITCQNCSEVLTAARSEHEANVDDGDCTTAVTCKHCTTVLTEAKSAHEAVEDDGDCTTDIICKHCEQVAVAGNASHTPNADDGNCLTAITCQNCSEVLTAARSEHEANADDGDCTTDIICKYCEQVVVAGNASHTPNDDDSNCTTAITCSICGTTTTPAKESHAGGTATCVSGKHCEVCNTEYDTTKNPVNHDLTTVDDNSVCGCGQLLTFVITNSGVQTNYGNFADALAAWTDGTTLTLFSDATDLTETITTTAKGLTLDLNGCTIASTATRTIRVDGELTIRDSKDGGQIKGTVRASWNSGSGSGTILLEGGALESVMVSGIFTMTGGTVRNENGVAININNDSATVLITGGEIYGSTYGVWITSGNVIISGDAKITGASQCAISSFSYKVVISETPTISGGAGEFYLDSKITLNTQPADGEVWRVEIDTGVNSDITDGIFAIPGEGVTLDASKFASAMDGYEVKKNDEGELLLCNHTVSYYAVANGDGTHNMTCWCGGTVLETNVACSGGMATDTLLASCEYCGVAYGEVDPNVHYDIYTANMTEAELQAALTELLLAGQTEIAIYLADGDTEMLAAIDVALNSSGVDKDNIKLTFGSQNAIQNEKQLITALGNGGIITLTADIVLTESEYVKKNTTIALNGFTLTPGVLGLGVEEGCTLTVIGDGIVNGGEGLWVFDGTLNLQGGTVDWLNVCETSSTANISGGNVTNLTIVNGGTANISGGYVGALDDYEGTLIITGGTFGFDPSAYVDTTNYTVTESHGVWTVTKTN